MDLLGKFSARDVVDIAFVAILFYFLFLLIKGTRAVQILQGVGVLLLLLLLSYYLKLHTIYWLLHYSLYGIVVALPIVFQPELRRALGFIGRGGVFGTALEKLGREDVVKIVDEIVWTTSILSQTKTGALICIERETGLEEYIETGTKVNGEISFKLLLSIFMPKSPLHDGAVILRGQKVVAAGCYLPLSENVGIAPEKHYGTRHRAALGLTEQTDALVVVVSEETGKVSVANHGKLTRDLDEETLRKVLHSLLGVRAQGAASRGIRFSALGGKDGIEWLLKKKS